MTEDKKSIDVPVTVVDAPKPEKPTCYKSAVCPKSCDGNPETCSVKKAKKTSKKNEAPLAEKLEKAGFKSDAKPGVTEIMTDAAVQDLKTRADAAVAEKERKAQEERAAKEAERKAAKEQLARDEEILRAAQAGKEVKPEPLLEGWTYPAPEGGIEGIVKRTQEITASKTVPDYPMQNMDAVHSPQTSVIVPPGFAIAKTYSNDEMILLRNVIAKDCTEPEFKLLMYMANTYGLDPLLKQIWAVKRNDSQPAIIFAGRDGMLAIAHRSGHFDGMQSGVIYEGTGKDKKPVSAWCEIWRNDMTHSFKTDVPFSEYNTGYSVWKTNPSAMILKVAEAVCLRKAFSVSGLHAPEEIDMGDR